MERRKGVRERYERGVGFVRRSIVCVLGLRQLFTHQSENNV